MIINLNLIFFFFLTCHSAHTYKEGPHIFRFIVTQGRPFYLCHCCALWFISEYELGVVNQAINTFTLLTGHG